MIKRVSRMTVNRRIERDPDDYIKPWPFLDQLAYAGVGLVILALIVLRWTI